MFTPSRMTRAAYILCSSDVYGQETKAQFGRHLDLAHTLGLAG